jgi:hypothetical protein
MSTDQFERKWVKVGDDPLRYEFGRENETPFSPSVSDQLAYVEEEKYSSYFHWETYKSHEKGAKPSLQEAQEAAIATLESNGYL